MPARLGSDLHAPAQQLRPLGKSLARSEGNGMKLNHYNEVIQTEPGTRPTTRLEGTVAAVTASRLPPSFEHRGSDET